MNICFVEEPDSDLVKRKSLYIDPESELSLTLSNIQDSIESTGYSVDRSRYKYVKGRLCKFHIELVRDPDINTLRSRSNSLKKLSIDISKLTWEFRGQAYVLKLGKMGDKDLHITVAFLSGDLSEDDRQKIKSSKDTIISNMPKPAYKDVLIPPTSNVTIPRIVQQTPLVQIKPVENPHPVKRVSTFKIRG